MPEWKIETRDNIKYITLPRWEKRAVQTAFSTRTGGESSGPYASLNLALHVGDQADNVILNRSLLLGALETDIQSMVSCEQVHGSEIACVSKKDAGRGAVDISSAIPGCDGLISNTPGLHLAAFFADCFPIYFFDPRRRAVALAHAGWKGTIDRIAVRTVQEMQKHFDSQVQDLEVFIGPGIGPCCFKIQDDLAKRVQEEFDCFQDLLITSQDRLTWDLARTNAEILKDIGVPARQIEICGLCTACHEDLFFSYRRDKGSTGRMSAVIALAK